MKNKIIITLLIISGLLCMLTTNALAVKDQARLFMSTDFNNSTSMKHATLCAVATYRRLGYNVIGGTPILGYTTTSSRQTVLNYISGMGNNYAFFVSAHGNPNLFTMQSGNQSQYIRPTDITGYWHFVFLNSCSCMSTDAFARAFKTVGYSNRASLGWFNTVTFAGSEEWWSYFVNQAGTTNLRAACLAAADRCSNSTPIRIYGDKTWNGRAWDK